MPTFVLYHAGCWDGFCAAWAAWRVLRDTATYIPVQHGTPVPQIPAKADVYMLDFSYKRDTMLALLGTCHSLTVLDHHVTAEAELSGLLAEFRRSDTAKASPDRVDATVLFDNDKSGGRLAWEHFHTSAAPASWLVDYTEDRDLWRWALADSKEINTYLRSQPLDFQVWEDLHTVGRGTPEWYAMVRVGRSLDEFTKKIVADHVRFSSVCEIGGVRVPAVNATVFSSEIAGALAVGAPFGACYFDRKDGKRVWSLRSEADATDVAEIAKKYGGGGHKHAAGFETDQSKIVFAS